MWNWWFNKSGNMWSRNVSMSVILALWCMGAWVIQKWITGEYIWCMSDITMFVPDCNYINWHDITFMEYFNQHIEVNTNGCRFPNNIFKWIFLNGTVWIPIEISLKFVSKGAINNIPALVQIMAWRYQGYKPLSEPMMVRLPMHIWVTRPQWVKTHSKLVF